MGLEALLAIGILGLIAETTASKCPGFCTANVANCTSNNGKIVGYCANEMACCDLIAGVTGTCGSNFNHQPVAYFKSPHFPASSSGDIMCDFRLKLSEDSVGVRIDFLQFDSDGMGFGPENTCESDLFFVRGLESWTPQPRCGKLTGFSSIIDRRAVLAKNLKTLTLLALMSSPKYLWHIKVTQIYEESSLKLLEENGRVKRSRSLGIDFGKLWQPVTSFGKTLISLMSSPKNNETEQEDEDLDSNESERNLNPSLTSIIHGVNTDVSVVPWQVSLRLFNTNDKYTKDEFQEVVGPNCSVTEGIHFCGGSIVSPRHILTAAHCVFGTSKIDGMKDLTEVKVIVGDTNRCRDEHDNSTQYDISRVTFHYAFDSVTLQNDLAVITVKDKILFNENSKPVPLAGSDFELVTGHQALASGWGMSVQQETYALEKVPEILQSSDRFTIQNASYCHSVLEESLGTTAAEVSEHGKYEGYFDGVFCTGSESKNREGYTGQGDSGGPMVILDGDKYVQVGVVSFAMPYTTNVTIEVENGTTRAPGRRSREMAEKSCEVDEEVNYFQSVPFHRTWIELALLA